MLGIIDNNEDLTPLSKVRANIKRHVTDSKTKPKRVAILVSTGSYCPVHKMHIEIFEMARKHLEEQGWVVLGGWISPSHDHHIMGKLLPEDFIAAKDRWEMCRLATESSDWLDVGYWEAAQHFFVDFGAVTKETDRFLRETFSKELAETKLTPFYLCGADLVMRCRLWKSRSFGVIGVARGGWSIPEKLVPDITRAIKENRDEDGEKRFFFVTVETPDVSSTKIRKHLVAMERTELLELTFENVANYLLDLKREGVLGKSSFDRCVEAEEEKHKIAESNSDHDPPKSACMIS